MGDVGRGRRGGHAAQPEADPAPGEQRVIPDVERPGGWLVRFGDTDQSYVDLADPTHLVFDYVERMADVVDVMAPAGERIRALHVGGAGMTLPRYIAHTRPTSAQVVLEPDAELTAEVRARAPLPPRSGIKVRPLGGREALPAFADAWADLLVVDAFAGSRVPGPLMTAEAFAEYRRVLAGPGTLVLNVTDRGPLAWTGHVVRASLDAFASVRLLAESATLKGRRFGNVIIVATGDPSFDWDVIVRRASGAAFPHRVVHDLTSLAARDAFHDADPQDSPPPPSGATAFS